MLILEAGEVCHLASHCPYHVGSAGPCYGAAATRMNKFECEHVKNGKIVEGGIKIPGDQTGKMKVIME